MSTPPKMHPKVIIIYQHPKCTPNLSSQFIYGGKQQVPVLGKGEKKGKCVKDVNKIRSTHLQLNSYYNTFDKYNVVFPCGCDLYSVVRITMTTKKISLTSTHLIKSLLQYI